jgi:hypothetical protein
MDDAALSHIVAGATLHVNAQSNSNDQILSNAVLFTDIDTKPDINGTPQHTIDDIVGLTIVTFAGSIVTIEN